MSMVCAIRRTRLLAVVALAFAVVLSAASFAKADPEEGAAVNCRPAQPDSPVKLPGNSTTIALDCDADVRVELLAKTDRGEKITLDCDHMHPPAPQVVDNNATVKLNCVADVKIRLLAKTDRGEKVTLDCQPPAPVAILAPHENSATITLNCKAGVNVKLLAKTDQGKKATFNNCTSKTVPAGSDSSAKINLLQCDAELKVELPAKNSAGQTVAKCEPVAKINAPGPHDSATITLQCGADVVKVGLLLKTDQGDLATLNKCTKATVRQPAHHEKSATIELVQCDADVTVELPAKTDQGDKITLSDCKHPTVSPLPDGVTLTLPCDAASVTVELLAKTEQGEKVGLNCGTGEILSLPAPPDNSATIKLTCNPEVTVELLEKNGQGQPPLTCDSPAAISQPAPLDNSVKIKLKCHADVTVELLAQTTDRRQMVTVASNCKLNANVAPPAPADNSATISLKCDPQLTVGLPQKVGAEPTTTVTCGPIAKVDTPAPLEKSVTTTPTCNPDVKVELLAKTDQGEKVTLNCGADATVGNGAAITLNCEINVNVELPKKKQLTLTCDAGAPEATYILDQSAQTVTYRNAKFLPEKPAAKKCAEKRCYLGESNFIYCETWDAQFVHDAVHWVRCGTDAQNDAQMDEVTVDLQSGVMRQRFIGAAVKGIPERSWTCKVTKGEGIAAKSDAGKVTKESTTTEITTRDTVGAVITRAKTTTEKVTSEKGSAAAQ
jgi:hypothetical protein